jgi:peptidoglycan-N-acetylglucosamine deacetylase
MTGRWRLWRWANRARLAVERPLLLGGAVCRGPAFRPWVALTFDDGPDERWTPGIVEALRQAAARATFFFIGEHVERCPDLAREVLRDHQVGTHLYSHRHGVTRDAGATVGEIERVLEAHQRILGARPTSLRFPFGERGVWTARKLAPWKLTPFHWTFSSLDSRARAGTDIVRFVVPRLEPGAIVLLHDGHGAHSTLGRTRGPTVEALPGILEAMSRLGLRAVTVDELLRATPAGRSDAPDPTPSRDG